MMGPTHCKVTQLRIPTPTLPFNSKHNPLAPALPCAQATHDMGQLLAKLDGAAAKGPEALHELAAGLVDLQVGGWVVKVIGWLRWLGGWGGWSGWAVGSVSVALP